MQIKQETLAAENTEAWNKVSELQESAKKEERSHASAITALQVRR